MMNNEGKYNYPEGFEGWDFNKKLDYYRKVVTKYPLVMESVPEPFKGILKDERKPKTHNDKAQSSNTDETVSGKSTENLIMNQIVPSTPISKYNVTERNVKAYITVMKKQFKFKFPLVKFKMTYDDFKAYGDYVTFTDGRNDEHDIVYLCIPERGYRISIPNTAGPGNFNLDSIIENGIILCLMNGIRMNFRKSNAGYPYDMSSVADYARRLLIASLIFYTHHRIPSKNEIKLGQLSALISMRFLELLADKGRDTLMEYVLERNTKTFRSIYGHGNITGNPVRLTIGPDSMTRSQKHSISMTKYGDNVKEAVHKLHDGGYSIRKITELLNSRGCTASLATVQRIVSNLTTV